MTKFETISGMGPDNVIWTEKTTENNQFDPLFKIILDIIHSVLAVDDCHVAFCEYNGSAARIICVAVATLANKKQILLCKK